MINPDSVDTQVADALAQSEALSEPQRIAMRIDDLQNYVTRPSRQALHQQQLKVGIGLGQGMVGLHVFDKDLNALFDPETLPGIHQ